MSGWQRQLSSRNEPENIRDLVSRVNHDINNALAILVGNVQCMLMQKQVIDQNTVSRLKRMERALEKISEANHKILELARSERRSETTEVTVDREKSPDNV
jgi:signal transduction histidine kinase